jgi:hypothetical protein
MVKKEGNSILKSKATSCVVIFASEGQSLGLDVKKVP